MRRLLGALLVSWVAFVGASCGDGGADDDEATSTTDRSTTTSTVAPTTTTSTTEPVPFDVEVRRAAIELLEVRNDVFMHPDVTRVSEYLTSTCTCLDRERRIVEGFVRDGVHWAAPPLTFEAIQVLNPDEVEPTLTLIATQASNAIVDVGGAVVDVVPSVDRLPYRVSVLRVEDRWRLNALEPITLNEDVIDQVLAGGLP